MKTIFFIAASIVASMQSVFAQDRKDSTLDKDPLKNVLAAYIELKNSLAGDDEANVTIYPTAKANFTPDRMRPP